MNNDILAVRLLLLIIVSALWNRALVVCQRIMLQHRIRATLSIYPPGTITLTRVKPGG